MTRVLVLLALVLSTIGYSKPKPKHHMALKDNLIAYWDMEQNPTLFRVWDQSGNGNHLLGFNPSISIGGILGGFHAGSLGKGKIGQSIYFNEIGEYLEGIGTTVNHTGTDYSVVLWFKADRLFHNEGLLASQNWLGRIVLSGSDYYVNIRIAGGNLIVTDVPLSVGQWYFVALGWHDSPEFGQYSWATVNLSDRVREARAPWTDTAGSFAIGTATAAIGPLEGTIDETAIWRRRISAAELREIYNKGAGLPFAEWDTSQECVSSNCCD